MTEPIGELKVENIDVNTFQEAGIELVFSALPSDIAAKAELELAENGFKVFSNASAYRMDPEVPLLIADINPDHLSLIKRQKEKQDGYIVTNPNCTVAGLATGLKPLVQNFNVKGVDVVTYQALSGAGHPGVPAKDIEGNIIPYIAGEEEKVEVECNKILGNLTDGGIQPASFTVIASCARVPVRDGHLENVMVTFDKEVNLDEVKNALSEYKGLGSRSLPTAPEVPILVTEEENRPQPIKDIDNGSPENAKGMAVTTGRFKLVKSKLRFYLLVHNTIRGAAGCSIINAELAKVDGYL